MIEFRGFSCFYKVKRGYLVALDEIDLAVNDGELLVVIGESGSGKSTLLRCILNLQENTSGKLLIDGSPANAIDMRDNIFAYVSQQYILYPHMLIYENIAYPLRTMKTSHEEVDQRVRAIAAELEITHLLNRKPRQLSGGQHQRVAIARALIKHPKYILMDEPFSNVDPELRSELRQMVRNIHRQYDSTIIFVTHDLQEAFSLADRIAVLTNGKVEEIGTPRELRTTAKSELLRGYLEL